MIYLFSSLYNRGLAYYFMKNYQRGYVDIYKAAYLGDKLAKQEVKKACGEKYNPYYFQGDAQTYLFGRESAVSMRL